MGNFPNQELARNPKPGAGTFTSTGASRRANIEKEFA